MTRLTDEECPTFEAVAELGKLLGLSKSASLALALLFTEEVPLSLDDIAHRTGIAKSSISVILKNLEQLGLVLGTAKPNDRRKYYRMTSNPGDAFAMVIARQLDNLTVCQQEVLSITTDSPDEQDAAHSTEQAANLQQLRNIYQSLAQLSTFFRTRRADAWTALYERLTIDNAPS